MKKSARRLNNKTKKKSQKITFGTIFKVLKIIITSDISMLMNKSHLQVIIKFKKQL